jgi:hypothetical protein
MDRWRGRAVPRKGIEYTHCQQMPLSPRLEAKDRASFLLGSAHQNIGYRGKLVDGGLAQSVITRRISCIYIFMLCAEAAWVPATSCRSFGNPSKSGRTGPP